MDDDSRTLIDEVIATQRGVERELRLIDTDTLGDAHIQAHLMRALSGLDHLLDLERLYLDSATRRYLAHGQEPADRAARDRTRISELREALRQSPPGNQLFLSRLDTLMRTVRCHMARQEEHLVPRLRYAVPAGLLTSWGSDARRQTGAQTVSGPHATPG